MFREGGSTICKNLHHPYRGHIPPILTKMYKRQTSVLQAKRSSLRLIWLTVLVVSNAACLIHLYFLLNTFFVEPNSVSLTYVVADDLTLPRIHVCQPTTRFIDWSKATGTNKEQFYALELALGLLFSEDDFTYLMRLNMTNMEEYAQQLDIHASEAYRLFYSNYGRQCSEIFGFCGMMYSRQVNCRDIFEPIFTMRGLCWVSKKDALTVRGNDALANFRFRLKFDGRDQLEQVELQPYQIYFAQQLEQGLFQAEEYKVTVYSRMTVKMVQNRRVFLPDDRRCLQAAQPLSYFHEYSRSNCNLERSMLAHINRLLNTSCELPLVELLHPGYQSTNLCTFDQMLSLFGFQKVLQPVAFGEELGDFAISLIHSQPDMRFLLPAIGETCNVWKNQSALPKMHPKRAINSAGVVSSDAMAKFLPTEAHFNVFSRTLPALLFELQRLNNYSDDPTCLPFCDSTNHEYRTFVELIDRNQPSQSFDSNYREAEVFMQYTTKEVIAFSEEPRQTIAEYIAMIGGNIGMRNGASIVSIAHLFALMIAAVGFHPF
uniref:Uncharacterized protein n=1 Tax=Plectus sambesii TaxID=2011161 RepID=A0A914W9E1_9BILA